MKTAWIIVGILGVVVFFTPIAVNLHDRRWNKLTIPTMLVGALVVMQACAYVFSHN